LFPVIGRLRQSPEATIANYATVIIRRVADSWSPKQRSGIFKAIFSLAWFPPNQCMKVKQKLKVV
jgi:hypothetical protein